jgi:hypothetical protein
MNKMKKAELISKLSNALLTISVLPDMTALKNEKSNLGICGFALIKEQQRNTIIVWKHETGDEYSITEIDSREYEDRYLHHIFGDESIKLRDYFEKWR